MAVQRRERVVQDQHRARVGQRSCQCQALGLTAGKAGAAGADDGIHTVFHGQHFAIQRGGSKPRHGILFTAAENIVLHRIGAQLRIMAQVTNGGGDLPRGQGSKFRFAKFCRAAVGCLAQEHPAKGGFAAGHRAGDANDIAGVRRQAQAGKDGSFAIGKGEVFQRHVLRRRDMQGFQLFRLLHQWLDALPRDLGFLHRVEQLCHLGGFDHQFREAGKEGGERRNVPCAPARAEHIFSAEPQNEQHACLGRCQIQRRQSGLPHIVAHGCFFVGVQGFLVLFYAGILTAVNAVGHSIPGAVEGGSAQRTCCLFVRRTGALHRLFHPCRAHVGKRREQQAEQRQPPVVHQQHHSIAHQRHAGIKDLGGELAHPLYAVVHIRDGLGHQFTGAFFFQRRPALPHQIGIQDALHPAVDVVGKAADIKALDKARRLHRQRDHDIGQHQHGHFCRRLAAAQNVGKALGQPALEPRRCQQADVIHKARQRDKGQREPLCFEIGEHPVRAERFILFHEQPHLLQLSGNAGSPRGSRSWMLCTACSAQRQRQRLPRR